MKTCTKCNSTKPLIDFHANSKRRDGLQCWCKDCRSAHAKATYDPAKARAYRTDHKDEIRARKRAYLQTNRDKERARIKRWARANPDKARAQRTARWIRGLRDDPANCVGKMIGLAKVQLEYHALRKEQPKLSFFANSAPQAANAGIHRPRSGPVE